MSKAIKKEVEILYDGQMRFDIPSEFAKMGSDEFWMLVNGKPKRSSIDYEHEGDTVMFYSDAEAVKITDKVYFVNR